VSPYRTSSAPLRMMVFRGTVERVSDVAGPTHGDVAKVGTSLWIYNGTIWRRLKTLNEPKPKTPREEALHRLKTPLRLGAYHGDGHSEETLAAIPNPERGDYAVGAGGKWIYTGIAWRRMKGL